MTVGLPDPADQLTIPALSLAAQEKSIRGSYMSSAVPRRDIPRLIELHLKGSLPVDQLLSAMQSPDPAPAPAVPPAPRAEVVQTV